MRTFDIELVELIVNHPSCIVGQYTTTQNPKKYRAFKDIGNLENYFLFNRFGGWAFYYESPGIYRCHFCYLPEYRGEKALNHSKECFDYMRDIGAQEIHGYIAKLNSKACQFVKKLGCFYSETITGDYWLDNVKTDLEHYKCHL